MNAFLRTLRDLIILPFVLIEHIWKTWTKGKSKMPTNEEILEIYAKNQEAVDAVWLEMGEATTMREATLEWIRRRQA